MYDVRLSEDFVKDCADIRKRGRTDVERVRKALYSMKADPIRNSKFLSSSSDLRGKRSKRIGDIRMIYAVCHECHDNRHMTYNNCGICPEIKDLNTVIMFGVKDRKEVYEV